MVSATRPDRQRDEPQVNRSRWHLAAITLFVLMVFRRRSQAHSPTPQDGADVPRAGGLQMRHVDYATDHAAFSLWIDSAIEWVPVPRWVPFPRACSALFLGVLVYLGGLAISLPFSFHQVYISTLAVYLGAFGFSLVLFVASTGHRCAHASYEHLRPVFTVSDEFYKALLSEWFGRLADKRGIRWATVGVFVFGCAVVAINYGPISDVRRLINLTSLRPPAYPSEWFTKQNVWPAVLVQLFYAAACAAAMGTGARMLVINLRFSMRLRHVPIIPVPSLVRARLRQVTGLYVRVSLGWTLGVLLFVVLFRGAYDPLSISFIAALFLLGLLQLAVPQLIFRRYIYNSYDRLCGLALRQFYAVLGVNLEEREEPEERKERGGRIDALVGGSRTLSAVNLAELAEMTGQPKTWIYDGRDAALWLGGQGVAIALLLLQAALRPPQ